MYTLPPVRAVAVDLDGTLLDTIDEIVAAANGLLTQYGAPPLPSEQIKSFVGKGIANLVRQVLGAAGLKIDHDAAVRQFEDIYFTQLNTLTTPFEGVVDGLHAMRSNGFKLVVATNKAMRFSRVLLDGQRLTQYFDAVYAGDSFVEKKPHAMVLQSIAKDLHIRTSELLMVGDSGNDVQAARNAGCPVVVVPYGYREGHTVESLHADMIVSSFVELAKLVTIIRS
jgi:phosphoglycolate phosphatase